MLLNFFGLSTQFLQVRVGLCLQVFEDSSGFCFFGVRSGNYLGFYADLTYLMSFETQLMHLVLGLWLHFLCWV